MGRRASASAAAGSPLTAFSAGTSAVRWLVSWPTSRKVARSGAGAAQRVRDYAADLGIPLDWLFAGAMAALIRAAIQGSPAAARAREAEPAEV
jgi:hypothetical protein